MPVTKLKIVWDYCTYNKPFFLLILFLFFFGEYYLDTYHNSDLNALWALYVFVNVVIIGYGMTITRDRINDGKRLPKIMVKDVFILGFKALIVYIVYVVIQGVILDFVCSPLDFPNFDLEDLLMELPDTMNMLFSHNVVDTFIFIVLGSLLFYITAFFMEIALAKLADTESLRSAFKLKDIKRSIDLIGWRNYAKEYTTIILTIVIFSSLKYVEIPEPILNYIWDVILSLFVFVTQYLGIGAVYSRVKKKESEVS